MELVKDFQIGECSTFFLFLFFVCVCEYKFVGGLEWVAVISALGIVLGPLEMDGCD